MTRHQRSRKGQKIFGVLISLALVASACGDDDDDEGGSTTEADTGGDTTPDTAAPDTAAPDTAAPDTAASDTAAPDTGGSTDGEGVKLGIMAECEGAFGGFNEDVQAGVALAMINEAGATSNSPTTATEGFSGATAGGLPIEVVSVGCGDDTADRAIEEIRKIVEQDGANVVIGPLSGDEGIAIANYAKDHPEVTFINGISGAQEATLQVQAPNFFRFNGDGAQWNAGTRRCPAQHRWMGHRGGHRRRLRLRLDIGGGIHRRVLRCRR